MLMGPATPKYQCPLIDLLGQHESYIIVITYKLIKINTLIFLSLSNNFQKERKRKVKKVIDAKFCIPFFFLVFFFEIKDRSIYN